MDNIPSNIANNFIKIYRQCMNKNFQRCFIYLSWKQTSNNVLFVSDKVFKWIRAKRDDIHYTIKNTF